MSNMKLRSKKKKLSKTERARLIEELTAEMRRCASHLEFERAAYLRDRVRELREENEKNG